MRTSLINVSTEVRAMVEAEAKAVCSESEVKVENFNQDLCAITSFRCLLMLGVEIPEDEATRDKVMQVLKKTGNSSALRQAIETPAKTSSVLANKIAAELLKPSK